MLEDYFVKPDTVDRIRASWIGPQIEQYVIWLADRGYGARCVWRRVPLLVAFGEFARLQGARSLADLPGHVDDFAAKRAGESRDARRGIGQILAKDIRGPVEQLLELVVEGFKGTGRPHHAIPFAGLVPGFFEYLTSERGLRPASVTCYRHHLDRFEGYLQRVGVAGLDELSPALLSAFVAERSGAGLAKTTVREGCGVLRVFLRYAHREGLVRGDLWKTVEWPQAYRLSTIPRSISWEDVGKVLAAVDRRTPCGKRDYAILLLLVTYGLRAREVAALTLDDIDWRRERLAIPERKAGHSTAFPLSGAVGQALADYLQHGRPDGTDRHVFFRAMAPVRPIGTDAVSGCARRYLLRAGIEVPRPGSHTLRHSAVQRLVDAGFSAPQAPYDVPVFARVKVHRDFHIEVARALYSAPKEYLGCHLDARADAALVKLYSRGQLVKVHPRQQPGRRSTDPADLPAEKTTYAMRDVASLARAARRHGDAIGVYAERLLDTDLPWTKMRQVYRLLGLVRRYGPGPVETACARALELDVVNVTKIASMLEKATENASPPPPRQAVAATARFARDPAEYRPRHVQLTLIDGGEAGTR